MSVTIIRIAAPIMLPKDTECVITAETTRMGTTAISVNGPFIEIQMCLRITQTLVWVSIGLVLTSEVWVACERFLSCSNSQELNI